MQFVDEARFVVRAGSGGDGYAGVIHPGANVGKGSDDTLFAKVGGRVSFDRSRGRSVVSVREESLLEEATA